jgi:hypothetical protein
LLFKSAEVVGHLKADRIYAWAHETDDAKWIRSTLSTAIQKQKKRC